MPKAPIGKGSAWTWLRYCVPALLALCTAAAPRAAHAQFRARDRILESVDASRWSVMRGHLRPVARAQFDRGELDPATRLGRVTMFFSRTAEQEADLLALLDQQQDRASPNYHRWLSPEEFADRFGLTQGDLDKIVAWLQAQGLTVEQVSRSRDVGGLQRHRAAGGSGSAYRFAALRRARRIAFRRQPRTVPAQRICRCGARIPRPRRFSAEAAGQKAPVASHIGNHRQSLPGAGRLGHNLQSGASIQRRNKWQRPDAGHRRAVGHRRKRRPDVSQSLRSPGQQPANHSRSSATTDDPGMVDSDIDEAYLDVEWAGAVARNATILYVYSENVLDAFAYIIDQNLAPVLSISYGLCEGGTDGFTKSDADYTGVRSRSKANAKGITIVAPTGDAGAADCDLTTSAVAEQGLAVDLPGALPYVTSVGGTRFSGDASDPPTPSGYWGPATSNPNTALSYIPETSWNDTDASGLAATGGGSSIYFAKPSWQTGAGVPKDGARDVPDVSFNASANHDGYLVCSRDVSTNSPTCVSGFRMSLPPLGSYRLRRDLCRRAGVCRHRRVTESGGEQPAGQGNVNPRLYALAAASPSSFHDITTGDNKVPFRPSTLTDCTPAGTVPIGYSAGAGYDLVTALAASTPRVSSPPGRPLPCPLPAPNVTPIFRCRFLLPRYGQKRGACGTTQLTLTRPNGFAGTPRSLVPPLRLSPRSPARFRRLPAPASCCRQDFLYGPGG